MNQNEFDEHVLRMESQGYAILPDVFTESECDEAQQELERLTAAEIPLECLFNKARVFEQIYQVPHLLRFLRYFLGEDACLSGAYGSIRRAGEGAGGLHSDGAITGHNRTESIAVGDYGQRITSHILGINVIICVSEFTNNNGATVVVPGSFRSPNFDISSSSKSLEKVAVASRGSALVFNINTWHGSGANNSSETRYALLTPWRRSWTRSEYDLPAIVNEDVLRRAGKEGERIFGIASRMPYTEGWQWDRERGQPKKEWVHLKR